MSNEAGKTAIRPLSAPIAGSTHVPGDKSISHRAVLFSAMAEGTSQITGILDSADVRSSIRAIEALGAEVSLEKQPDGSLAGGITGWGEKGPVQPLSLIHISTAAMGVAMTTISHPPLTNSSKEASPGSAAAVTHPRSSAEAFVSGEMSTPSTSDSGHWAR